MTDTNSLKPDAPASYIRLPMRIDPKWRNEVMTGEDALLWRVATFWQRPVMGEAEENAKLFIIAPLLLEYMAYEDDLARYQKYCTVFDIDKRTLVVAGWLSCMEAVCPLADRSHDPENLETRYLFSVMGAKLRGLIREKMEEIGLE